MVVSPLLYWHEKIHLTQIFLFSFYILKNCQIVGKCYNTKRDWRGLISVFNAICAVCSNVKAQDSVLVTFLFLHLTDFLNPACQWFQHKCFTNVGRIYLTYNCSFLPVNKFPPQKNHMILGKSLTEMERESPELPFSLPLAPKWELDCLGETSMCCSVQSRTWQL